MRACGVEEGCERYILWKILLCARKITGLFIYRVTYGCIFLLAFSEGFIPIYLILCSALSILSIDVLSM